MAICTLWTIRQPGDNGFMAVAREASHRLARRWRDEPRLRRLPVVVCAVAGVFAGDTFRLEEQRLLDALNRGFVARALRMAGDFMPLADVEFFPINGRKMNFSAVHVHKSAILFVAEKPLKAQDTAVAPPQNRKSQLLRMKAPLLAEMHVPPYVIEGNVYVESWGELSETIEVQNRFMPLTEVKVRPALIGGESSFKFVAVNRERILCITEFPRTV